MRISKLIRISSGLLLAAVLVSTIGSATISGHSRSAPELDLRIDGGPTASFLRDFDPSALHRSVEPDQIRAIDNPRFDPPGRLVRPTDLIAGLELGGDARAYPIDLLSLHEVVNDVVGRRPIAVTWCPLCRSALAFDRRLGGRTLTFGVSGYLLHGNQVLFDRQTGSLWSQLLGGAVTGRYRGTRLAPVPILLETWAAWRAQHPRTKVLSIIRDTLAYRVTHPYDVRTDRGPEGSDTPYDAYFAKVPVYFPRLVRGIHDSEEVLGLVLGDAEKAYRELALERHSAVNDAVAGTPVLAAYDGQAFAASIFDRRLRGRTLSFRPAGRYLVDLETRSRWSPATGAAIAGPLTGASLTRLPTITSYWFAWRALHPNSAVFAR